MSYVYYLHGIVSGPDAPLALALVFPSPCYGSPLTYHTVVHQYSKGAAGRKLQRTKFYERYLSVAG